MPGGRLGRFWRNVRASKVGNEGVAQAVKVGESALRIRESNVANNSAVDANRLPQAARPRFRVPCEA